MATVHFDRSSGLRLDGLGGDVHLETVNRSSLDGLLIHSIIGYWLLATAARGPAAGY